jgi:hypothetical protein
LELDKVGREFTEKENIGALRKRIDMTSSFSDVFALVIGKAANWYSLYDRKEDFLQ